MYRIFKRTWWKDRACTIPGPGRKTYMGSAQSEQEAREKCAEWGLEDFGPSRRGPKGMAYEYERV